MPTWFAFLFGALAGALLVAFGLLLADWRHERRMQRQVTEFEKQSDERQAETLGRLWAAAAEVERRRGEG